MKNLAALLFLFICAPPITADDSIPQGRLGHPLGTYLTIEGVRAEEGKVGTQTLLVDTINGEKLDEPIGVWIENVSPLPEAERTILRGYESGRMIGLPEEVALAENLPSSQAMWQFFRYFIMTSVVQPQGLGDGAEPAPSADPLPEGETKELRGVENRN